MAINLATYELNPDTVAVRAAEVPDADFAGGMNEGGSNAPGIGISTGSINPKVQDWTTTDSDNSTRNPQHSQHLGGGGLGDGSQDRYRIQCVQGADINDSVSFIEALTEAAPGQGFGNAGADPVNRTSETIEVGDRAWGTNTIA